VRLRGVGVDTRGNVEQVEDLVLQVGELGGKVLTWWPSARRWWRLLGVGVDGAAGAWGSRKNNFRFCAVGLSGGERVVAARLGSWGRRLRAFMAGSLTRWLLG
jgi:hypothetical protein